MSDRPTVRFDLAMLRNATYVSQKYYEKAIQKALQAQADAERERRLQERECRFCFYIRRPRIAGQAFTAWQCLSCCNTYRHPNTATPRLCAGCSEDLHACTYCGADLDFHTRDVLHFIFEKDS